MLISVLGLCTLLTDVHATMFSHTVSPIQITYRSGLCCESG